MNNNNRSKKKPPIYVKIYNELLKNIQAGLYVESGKLPSEHVLAEQMGVSRMTLRQSLTLLQEDGVIISRKGVGNFIKSSKMNNIEGLEYIGNVLEKCGIKSVDRIDCEYRLEPPELFIENKFGRKTAVLLVVSLYYYDKDEYQGESFSMIATDLQFIQDKDLSQEEVVKDLVLNSIYEESKVANYNLTIVESDSHLKLHRNKGSWQTLLTEKLLSEDGTVLSFTKYRFPLELTEIKINSYKK